MNFYKLYFKNLRENYFTYFFPLFFALSIPYIFLFVYGPSNTPNLFLEQSGVLAALLTLFAINKKIFNVIISILFIFGFLNIFTILNFQHELYFPFIATSLETNTREAFEFIVVYFDLKYVAAILIYLLIVYSAFKISLPRLIRYPIRFIYIVLIIIGLGKIIKGRAHNYIPIYNIYHSFNLYQTELSIFQENRALFSQRQRPKNEVLGRPFKLLVVIGESLQKNYQSLYGFTEKTTPKLDVLKKQGAIQLLSDSITPSSHTNTSLQKVFTFEDSYNRLKWNKSATLIDVLRSSGYETSWISNQ